MTAKLQVNIRHIKKQYSLLLKGYLNIIYYID